MATFVTHPSVRIKGTENNYNPVQCLDADCPNKNPHMHCPFCVKTESFQDPVILRAHYRVKHVDKGLEFAGLKVLRCCDHCDIVGAIKGEKKFKGAHWHCYRCRNGFNRRDEAVKHFKTHFRNPQTTFQIQITQEVNQPYPHPDNQEIDQATESITQIASIHPALTEAVMSTTSTESTMLTNENEGQMSNGKSSESGDVHVSVAANETVETVGTPGGTIMIIHEDDLEAAQNNMCATTDLQITNTTDPHLTLHYESQEQKQQLEKKCQELQQKNEQLLLEKAQCREEVEQLKLQVQMQAVELGNYQKREQELLKQLTIPLDSKLEELLNSLQSQHTELLHQQLAQLKRTYTQAASANAEACLQYEHIETTEQEQQSQPQPQQEQPQHQQQQHQETTHTIVMSCGENTNGDDVTISGGRVTDSCVDTTGRTYVTFVMEETGGHKRGAEDISEEQAAKRQKDAV